MNPASHSPTHHFVRFLIHQTRSTNVTPSPALPASPATSERSDVHPKCPFENLQQHEPSPPPSPTDELSTSGATASSPKCEARRPATPYRASKSVVFDDDDEQPCCSRSLHKDTNKHEGQSDEQQEPNDGDDKVEGKDHEEGDEEEEEEEEEEDDCSCEEENCVHYQQTDDEDPDFEINVPFPFSFCQIALTSMLRI